jgi:flagellar motor switch protein FliN/FliY
MANDDIQQGASPTPAADAASAGQSYSPDELDKPAAAADQPGADINLDLVLEVPVTVSLRVGSTDITIRDLVQLVEGSVVALDREATEPLDVLVNGTLIAHGEIVVVDGAFGVRLTDVVSPAERIRNIN